MMVSRTIAVMTKRKNRSKTHKEIFSTDYHIPGISPRFYLLTLALAAVIVYITPGIKIGDLTIATTALVFFFVSTISITVQRLLRLFHRKWRSAFSPPGRRRPPEHRT
jgi:hypothetical protein